MANRLHLVVLLIVSVGSAGCTVASANPGARDSGAIPDAGASAGIDAGAPQGKLLTAHPRMLLKFPREKRLDCRKDSDCVFWSKPCSCTPCGPGWREVVNRKEWARLRKEWTRRRCEPAYCPACEREILGTVPICGYGQCAAR